MKGLNNIQKLALNGNKNHKLFARTIVELKQARGFYARLYDTINSLSDESYEELYETLNNKSFADEIDVILYLET